MSVPVNQRSQSKLEACVKAHDLCVYTLQITANDKIFKAEYRAALTKEKVDESFAAWRNHAGKGNTYNLLRRMDEYYTGLWKGGEADAGKKRDYEPE